MVGVKEAGGNDDPIVLKVATLPFVGRITDIIPEKLFVFVDEVMFEANDVALPLEAGKLLLVDDCPTMGVPKKDSLLPLVWKDGSIVFVKLPCVIVVRKLMPLVKLCLTVCVLDPPPDPSVVTTVTCISELDLSSCLDTNVLESLNVY